MTIYQRPNVLAILIIIALAMAGLLPAGTPKLVATAVAIVLVSAWGYDELRYGVNWLRRTAGLIALLLSWTVLLWRLQ